MKTGPVTTKTHSELSWLHPTSLTGHDLQRHTFSLLCPLLYFQDYITIPECLAVHNAFNPNDISVRDGGAIIFIS